MFENLPSGAVIFSADKVSSQLVTERAKATKIGIVIKCIFKIKFWLSTCSRNRVKWRTVQKKKEFPT